MKKTGMMEKTVKRIILAAMAALLLMETGCGSSSSAMGKRAESAPAAESYEGAGSYATADAAYEEYDEAVEESSGPSPTDEVTEDNAKKSGTKIIRNASISIKVDDLNGFSEDLKQTVGKYNGYVESSDVNDYDSDYSEYRYGYFTVRIPAEKLDDFLNIVEGKGKVTAKNETVEDVTLQYVDLEAHIDTYEAERDSLMELLDKAETVEDILSIRSELNDINYELDSLQRQLKAMENKVSYSTVTVNATESRSVGGGKQSFVSRFLERFGNEMSDGLEMASDFLIFIITRIPLFILLGLFIFAIVKIVMAIIRSAKKTREKKGKKTVKPGVQPAGAGSSEGPADIGSNSDGSGDKGSNSDGSAGAVVAGAAAKDGPKG